MGFADALFKMKIPYNSEEGIAFGEEVMEFLQKEAHQMSEDLSEERGVFPNWKNSLWDNEKNRSVRKFSRFFMIGVSPFWICKM